MGVTPGFIAQRVERINDLGWVSMTTNVRTASQQKVGCKALHVIEIVHVIEGFSPGENLTAGRVNHQKVAQHLGLEGGRDVHASFAWFSGQRVVQWVQSQGALKGHAIEAVAGVEQEG